MTTIMPQNELVNRAFQWILSSRAENPGRGLHNLLDEAGMRFNLSPAEADQLLRLHSAGGPGPDARRRGHKGDQ